MGIATCLLLLCQGSDELTYSGPLRFFYHAPGADTESFRMMTLSDRECVRDILPTLRQRFGVPENLRCTLHEDINGGWCKSSFYLM